MNRKTKIFFHGCLCIFLASILWYAKNEDPKKTLPHAVAADKRMASPSAKLTHKNEVQEHLKDLRSPFPKSEEISSLTDKDFKKMARDLSKEDLNLMKEIVISPVENKNKRQSFLFLLTHLGSIGTPALIEIAKAGLPHFDNLDHPHSADALLKTFELSLRITAIEAIDRSANEIPQIKEKWVEILNAQKREPSLAFLVQIGLSGVEGHRPGKVKRFIDLALAEKKI